MKSIGTEFYDQCFSWRRPHAWDAVLNNSKYVARRDKTAPTLEISKLVRCVYDSRSVHLSFLFQISFLSILFAKLWYD